MESQLIYSSASHLKNKASWKDWFYCGIGEDLKEDIINNSLVDYFQKSILYFVSTRKESAQVAIPDIMERIKKDHGRHELYIWDADFKKVIEFNKIGVMRYGIVESKH